MRNIGPCEDDLHRCGECSDLVDELENGICRVCYLANAREDMDAEA